MARLGKALGLHSDLLLFRNFTLRQMWDLLHRAQVCVLPSLREGLSIVLLEAMALGTPVIGSDVHGINEAIVDGECGLLFEPGKPDDLAECLVKLLTDPALLTRLGKQAAKRARKYFDARVMARGHLDVYRQVRGGSAK
jgi:glycosyltransferase involved in cell wall biosynthesis